MSQFKALSLLVFVFAAQFCFAGACNDSHDLAEAACPVARPDFVKASQVMQGGEDSKNITAMGRVSTTGDILDYTKKLHATCAVAQRNCLKACKQEFENAQDINEKDNAFDIANECQNGVVGMAAADLENAYFTAKEMHGGAVIQQVSGGQRRKESVGYSQGFTTPFR